MILATVQKVFGFDLELGDNLIASDISRKLRDDLHKGAAPQYLYTLAEVATHVDPNARVVSTKDAVLFLAK